MGGLGGDRLGGVCCEPASVEPFGVVFVGSGEVPVAVPDFDPSVVAAAVGPHRGANGAGGDADSAADIGEDDRKPGAGGHALLDGLLGALVGALALGVVVGVDELEELLVEDLGGLGGGGGVLDQRRGFREEIGAPGVARFVEDGVGEDVVEKDVFGHLLGPGEGFAGLQGEVEVLGEELGAEGFLVVLGHVLDEKTGGLFAEGTVFFLGSGDEVISRGGEREGGGGEP